MSTTVIMEPDVQQKLAILGGQASDSNDVPATGSIKQGITRNRLYLKVAYAHREHLLKRRKE